MHLRCQQKKVGPKKVVAAVFTWSPGAILTSQKGSVTSKIDWQSCDEIKIMQLNFERDLIKTHPQKLGKSAEPFLRLGSRHCFSGVHFFIEICAIHVVLYIILTQPFNQTSSWTYPFEKKTKEDKWIPQDAPETKNLRPPLKGPPVRSPSPHPHPPRNLFHRRGRGAARPCFGGATSMGTPSKGTSWDAIC